jgi:GT2 family glycosyltransferase
VVVVDNASTDGTSALVAAEQPEADLVVLSRNTGGAGGFAAGLDRAVHRHEADLVWLLDDDTVPGPGALATLLAAREGHPPPAPTLLASRAVWTDGRDHPMNVPRAKPLASTRERAAAEQVGCVAIRSASFVSVLVDAREVRARGLPVADYFLWNDDFEYTTRLLRGRVGLYCPDSVVVHKTRTFGSTDVDPGARFYFEVRNKMWTFGRSRSLSPAEKILYGGSTLRRWVRTYAASRDRATLRAALRRGIADGVRTGPRPTGEVLAEAGLDR